MKLRARYYTVDSAAKELGLTKWMLLRLEKTGHIPTPHRDPINRYRIYDEAALNGIRRAINSLDTLETPIPA